MHLSLGDQQNFKFKEHNTPSIPNYKALSTNLCSLRKIVNLLNHIKYVNYLYYHFKITLFLSLYPLSCFSLMFGERIIRRI